jgi:hypothetical protein
MILLSTQQVNKVATSLWQWPKLVAEIEKLGNYNLDPVSVRVIKYSIDYNARGTTKSGRDFIGSCDSDFPDLPRSSY